MDNIPEIEITPEMIAAGERRYFERGQGRRLTGIMGSVSALTSRRRSWSRSSRHFLEILSITCKAP
jgi:hypothetical protein